MPERRIGDSLENWRGNHATVIPLRSWRIDHDDDRQLRLPRGQEPDKRRVVVGL